YLYVYLRDLYSFPTRRSSDLSSVVSSVSRSTESRTDSVVRSDSSSMRTASRSESSCMRTVDVPLQKQVAARREDACAVEGGPVGDRKSTRLNSSHVKISYAVF